MLDRRPDPDPKYSPHREEDLFTCHNCAHPHRYYSYSVGWSVYGDREDDGTIGEVSADGLEFSRIHNGHIWACNNCIRSSYLFKNKSCSPELFPR